jgi:signal transduction histidine kinase
MSFLVKISNSILQVFLGCSFVLQGIAQSPNYFVQHITNENGLPQNSVKALQADSKGFLWIATEMGLVRYDGSRFKIYNQGNHANLHSDRITHLKFGSDSFVYFSSDDKRCFRIAATGELLPLKAEDSLTHWLLDESANFPYVVYDSILNLAAKFSAPEWSVPDLRIIRSSVTNSIVRSGSWYYYFNNDQQLIAADTSLTKFKKVLVHQFSTGWDNVPPKPISLIQNGNKILIRMDSIIYELSYKDPFEAVANPVLNVGKIPNITRYIEWSDTQLKIIGTLSDGLYIFKKQNFQSILLDDVESNVFYAVAPFRNNGFLTKKAAFVGSREIPLPPGFTSESLLRTEEGGFILNYWISAGNAGLIRLDSNLKEKARIRENDLRVNCMQQLKHGTVLISAENKFLGKLSENKIQWLHRPSTISPDFLVKTFIESSDGFWWLGGPDGLIWMNPINNQVRIIPGLININVRTIYEDNKGIIWIGTYGKGFYCWYNQNLVRMPEDHSRFLSTVHSFIPDGKGYFWLSTNRGLFRVLIKDLYNYLDDPNFPIYYHYFDKSDGFFTNEFNGGCTPSGAILNNGQIVFPTVRGMVTFFPDSIAQNYSRAAVYVDAIRTRKEELSYRENKPVRIGSNSNFLEFEISSPYFGNQANNYIEYNLEEINTGWLPLQPDGKILFNKLPDGNYKLKLRKRTGANSGDAISKTIAFEIDPVFYKTYYFQGLIILFMVGLMYFLFKFRYRYLLDKKNKLEAEVSKRTSEQVVLIEHLEKTVKQLALSREKIRQDSLFRQKLALIIAHDLQSPLRFLSSTADWLYESYTNNPGQDYRTILKEISKSASVNYHFIEDFSTWIRSMGIDFQIQTESFPLNELVQEVTDFFFPLSREKNNTIRLQLAEDELFVYSDRQLLKIILRNLVDNANKFTAAGLIRIVVVRHENSCSIMVADNGAGMRSPTLQKLHQLINGKQESEYILLDSKGNGFRFIADFCKLLGIKIEIRSIFGEGSEICLHNIPLEFNSPAEPNLSILRNGENFIGRRS